MFHGDTAGSKKQNFLSYHFEGSGSSFHYLFQVAKKPPAVRERFLKIEKSELM